MRQEVQVTRFGATLKASQPTEASDQIGGHTRVRRTEGLRRVIGAVVQGARRRENPSLGCGHGFLGLVPEAVQFFEGLQADHTKACWSAHKAVYGPRCASPRRRRSMG
jgi:hypothetical protein